MGFTISTNLPSMTAQRIMAQKSEGVDNAAEKLASGSRINSAADDAAGLAISERLRGQIAATHMAGRNANDAVSIISTAEGGMHEISNIIGRLRELAMQSASDVIDDSHRHMIDEEFQAVKTEIQRIAKDTKWDGKSLLDGNSERFDFQVGVYNGEEADRISFHSDRNVATIDALGLESLNINSSLNARDSLSKIDSAQNKINGNMSRLGAVQNRLRSSIDNLQSSVVNRSAANSQIRDTDMAEQTTKMTQEQILQNAAGATLAQANQVPAAAMRFLS